MNRLDGFNMPEPNWARPNIRVIPARNPYRALTTSSGYPAAFGAPVSGSYLVIRDDQENSSSWPL
ncbi:Uncharacterized [Moorella glycerini]|uniref:Uncharacterized protein n=1 Tax=Neomoorella stamsii TaxID=1266720 RepID=A0A9X7J5Q4_9FIRM|nr:MULTISPECIES: hypothetical protein [Moorella]PRR76770.1 hypothetical protein MOST_04160 [Moorella stamsii]CEP66696.1 Uncharacterized [Moorella glycerini]